ncbi:MAG: DeoR/GlpR family DNA-binding transcription regulator [Intestinibaculum porci]|uniref:DeoR/GlpR family DNA-binding transcription regulator n=1 Tax=Intestinibaculum porci TaxID=2487118 RepID=UPI003F0DE0E1
MIPYERQQKIISIIQDRDLVKIEDLQEYFPDISLSTLRRDLKQLEKNRKIEFLSGGAVKKISTVGEIPIEKRTTLNMEKKEKIAEIAARYIDEGDTIYLDSGSSCTALFEKIMHKHITIYTSNTAIFSLIKDISAEIIILGGRFNPVNSSITGAFTESELRNLYFKKSFLGVNGVDEKHGVTSPTIEEATKKRMVKEHSDQVYLLCDSTKFHNLSNVKAFDLDDVIIISDQEDDKLSENVSLIVD